MHNFVHKQYASSLRLRRPKAQGSASQRRLQVRHHMPTACKALSRCISASSRPSAVACKAGLASIDYTRCRATPEVHITALCNVRSPSWHRGNSRSRLASDTKSPAHVVEPIRPRFGSHFRVQTNTLSAAFPEIWLRSRAGNQRPAKPT